ncbi:MAG: tRNA modification GTPase MnmE [Candidatus Dependentiae bacterium]|nr:tRNA modification GTPase MnmE [Candidatus Dependentiae bacterium]
MKVIDTIIASCTAPGAGALALLRLDGPAASVIAQSIARTKRHDSLVAAATHTIIYGHIVDEDGASIDQVLFLVMRAPRTFTGNEIIEITCHNNPFIVEAILARACAGGARYARPGEFTQRALLNGKIDMLQAEALHDLITAPSCAAARKSLAQLEGSLSQAVLQIEERLFALAVMIEASFEFSEEEHIDLDFDAIVRERLAETLQFIEALCAGQGSLQHVREGVKIALVGTVNAGKSTLLNTLIGRNRAIVSDRPGTTRDSIEAGMSVGGYTWTYIDTAGIRETADTIEQEGIIRTHQAAAGADVVLVVCDGSVEPSREVGDEYAQLLAEYASRGMLVLTKADKGPVFLNIPDVGAVTFRISAQTGTGVEQLKNEIFMRVKAAYESVNTPFILNQRQLALVYDVKVKLLEVQVACASPRPAYELIAAGVHDILRLVTELSGRSVTEQVMDKLFSTFCIGK